MCRAKRRTFKSRLKLSGMAYTLCYRQLILKIMYKYLEIVKDEGNEVVKRLNVSNKSERSIEKIENAMNINLNHNEYTVQYNESDVELPVI